MEKKQKFTREEVIELLYTERRRAVDICYHSRNKLLSTENKGFSETYRLCQAAAAEESRLLGNCISGMTGLDTESSEIVMRRLIERDLQ